MERLPAKRQGSTAKKGTQQKRQQILWLSKAGDSLTTPLFAVASILLALSSKGLMRVVGDVLLVVSFIVWLGFYILRGRAQVQRARIEGNRPKLVLTRAFSQAGHIETFAGQEWRIPDALTFQITNTGGDVARNVRVKVSATIEGYEDPLSKMEDIQTSRIVGAGMSILFPLSNGYRLISRAHGISNQSGDPPNILYVVNVAFEEDIYYTKTCAQFTALHSNKDKIPGALSTDMVQSLAFNRLYDSVTGKEL